MLDCTLCDLHKTANIVGVSSRGSDNPVILFVGEAPGRSENAKGLSFIGPAGQKLDELMKRTGLDPEICRWANIVRCAPWEIVDKKVRKPSEEEMDACSGWIEREIFSTDPVLIVPLGKTATSYLLESDVAITKVRGNRFAVNLPTTRFRYVRMMKLLRARGVVDPRLAADDSKKRAKAIAYATDKYGFKDVPTRIFTVYPTWHPAAILYGNNEAEYDLVADLNYLTTYVTNTADTSNYKLVTTVEEAVAILRQLRVDYQEGKFPYLSYDVEATSLDVWNPKEYLTTIGFTHRREHAWVLPWDHHESPFKGDALAQKAIQYEFNRMLEVVPTIGHNIKYDFEISLVHGFEIRKIYDDTELMSWTLFNDQSPHDLDSLVTQYTDLQMPKQEMKQAQKLFPKAERFNTDNYPLDLIYRYNGGDVDGDIRLLPVFEEKLRAENLYDAHKSITVAAIIPTISMEVNGCPIDEKAHSIMMEEMGSDLERLYQELKDLGMVDLVENIINEEIDKAIAEGKKKKRKSFSLGSPEQVSILLFDVLEFAPRKYGKVRKNGRLKGEKVPSSDKHVLAELLEEANEWVGKLEEQGEPPESGVLQIWKLRLKVVRAVQEYKRISKLYSSNVKNIPKHLCVDQRVRCSYGIRHTASGRYKCRNPSLHTVPWHSAVKTMYVSRFENGLILSADHAQAELRVFAMATGDEALIETFRQGKDIHRMIASRVLGCTEEEVPSDERRRIKTVVFGLLYGRGPRSIAAQEGISVQRAKDIIAGVFRQFPKVKGYIEKIHAYVRKHGYIPYINGFRRIVPVDHNDPARAERIAVNTSIQGPASDIAVVGLINMHRIMQKLRLNSILWEFKHDDLGYDIAPGELFLMAILIQREMVQRIAKTYSFVNVPMKVDYEVGVSWGHLVEMRLLEDSCLEFEGEEENVDPLVSRIMEWDDTPTILTRDVEVKKKTAVVRSLMKSTGEMVDYNHVTTKLQFPQFVRREPDYKYPGFIEMPC